MDKNGKPKRYSQGTILVIFIAMIVMITAIVIFHGRVKQKQAENPGASIASIILPGIVPATNSEKQPSASGPSVLENADNDYMISSRSKPEKFLNNRVLTTEVAYATKLSVGTESATDVEGICINPVLIYEREINPNEQYAFIVRADIGTFVCAGIPDVKGSSTNSKYSSLYITDRTYDKLVPAAYVSDSEPGLVWVSDGLSITEDFKATLLIQAIRLADGSMMGSAKAIISYSAENSVLYISDLYNSDISVTGEFSENVRDQVIRTAIDFVNTGNNKLRMTITDNEYESNAPFYIVEVLNHVIHPKLFDANGEVISAGSLGQFKPLLAVHIPHGGIGYITVYLRYGERGSVDKYNVYHDPVFTVAGYDAYSPFDVETFNAFLPEADRLKFRVS